LQLNAAAFIVRGVKRDAVTSTRPRRPFIQIAIDKLVALIPGSQLEHFFDVGAALVPLPGSGLSRTNSISATRSIAKALLFAGLGSRLLPCLRRNVAVQKSAFASPGERPDAIAHRDSMTVELPMHDEAPRSILLVDDVLTRGATAMGAAARLGEQFPEAHIKLFALARTDLLTDRFYEPIVGVITIQSNGCSLRRFNHALPPEYESGKLF
jgi:hypothetical protein